jgi:hypothetical protein
MGIFEYLQKVRYFHRRNLSFMLTMEDLDLVIAIGANQERGVPVRVKHLFGIGIGSAATLQRRLARLKRLGVVIQRRSESDRRHIDLELSPRLMRVFRGYSALIKSYNRSTSRENDPD